MAHVVKLAWEIGSLAGRGREGITSRAGVPSASKFVRKNEVVILVEVTSAKTSLIRRARCARKAPIARSFKGTVRTCPVFVFFEIRVRSACERRCRRLSNAVVKVDR